MVVPETELTATDDLWLELVGLEPRLQTLLEKAQAVKDDKQRSSFCASKVWYQDFYQQLRGLMGYDHAHHPYRAEALCDSDNYRFAYLKLYRSLPKCRGCKCIG